MKQALIHPTALVHPAAIIGEGTRIGAFSIVESDVSLGVNCEIQDHVIVRSFTRLGDEVKAYPFSVLGGDPQHTKYKGEPTVLEIGNRVTLRECVTAHRGTTFGRGVTSIGDDSFIMAYTHIAHDCIVGKGVTLANSVQLAGHCEVQDYATLGGMTGIPQFLRVGRFSYLGGGSLPRKDVPPFLLGKGNDFEVQGINTVGLTRRGFSEEALARLKTLYKIFFVQHLTISQATEKATTELADSQEVRLFLDFVRESKAGIVR